MLRILYGGTFDPVHNGHLAVARHARDALDAEVRLMPAADPPHKGPTRVDATQRAQMVALAVAGEPGLRIDRRELERAGPSYTYDTLLALRAQVGMHEPWAILVGADSFRSFQNWHRWRDLFGLAHIVVADRAIEPGAGEVEPATPEVTAETVGRWTSAPASLRERPAGRLFALEQPLFPESASELRRRIAAGLPWRDWVPPAVAAYIDRHGLYH